MEDNTEGLTPGHSGSDGIEFEDLCATFFDGQFSVTERINGKTGEVSAEARFKTTNEALDDLFDGPTFSSRDDDHAHLDKKKGDIKAQYDASEFKDSLLTPADIFEDEEDPEVRDPDWWDRENPAEDYDYIEGRKVGRGTDPEDEADYLVRNERVHRIAGSSLDPSGKSIYATKSVRQQKSAQARYEKKRYDGGWQEYERQSRGIREVSDIEKYADTVRYLQTKYVKKGMPVPTTDAEWGKAVAEHEDTQREKRIRLAVVDLICERQGCVRQTGYNRLKRMIRDAEQKGRWHEALLNAFIREAARRSHAEREVKRKERKRRPKRAAVGASETTPQERRDKLRGDPRMSRPDYNKRPPRHC